MNKKSRSPVRLAKLKLKEKPKEKIKEIVSKNQYEIKQQLGLKGKDGKTFLVVDKFGYEYAMKSFRANKSSRAIIEEADIQRVCASHGVAPKIIDVDTQSKCIVMEKMDYHLLDEINSTGGILTEHRQKELIKIFKIMDKIKILHGDVNLLNYMVKNGKLYMIDFGLGKRITPEFKKEVNSDNPNIDLSLLGFILKLKESNVNSISYKFLQTFVTKENRLKYKI